MALLLIAVAYHNVVGAGFVYDDQTQILQNNYIRSSGQFWKSMTVDVWAFRGDKGEAWSNYWRPVFVAWLHVNHELFAFRPVPGHARYRTPVAGLYLCGAAAHPGGGVMGTPGLNAAREILGKRRLRASA